MSLSIYAHAVSMYVDTYIHTYCLLITIFFIHYALLQPTHISRIELVALDIGLLKYNSYLEAVVHSGSQPGMIMCPHLLGTFDNIGKHFWLSFLMRHGLD